MTDPNDLTERTKALARRLRDTANATPDDGDAPVDEAQEREREARIAAYHASRQPPAAPTPVPPKPRPADD